MGLAGGLIGLGTGILGAISAHKAAKRTNKLNKEELAQQKALGDQQIKISDYIQGLSKELMAKGSTQVDPYGGSTGYDPATGTYKSTLGVVPQQLQNTSDQEELARNTIDQAIRRQGLVGAEGIRSQAATEAGSSVDDLNNFRRGIGAVDPVALAARMRLDRQGAVNAGYDQAAQAASTLQARTGSSAVGDALTKLARDRVVAQAQVGDPEVEALTTAQGLNSQRLSDIMGRYGTFANNGSKVADVGFTSAPYAGIADAKLADQMKFDLSKYDVAQGGSGTAAAGIGNAATGIRQAFTTSEANRVKDPMGNLISGIGNSLQGALKSIPGLG